MKNLIYLLASTSLLFTLAACDGGDGGSFPMQVERMGRPAINTALNKTFTDDATRGAAEDLYNETRYNQSSGFISEFADNLGIYDALVDEGGDSNACGDNPLTNLAADLSGLAEGASRYDFVATVLADDQLYVDSSAGGTCTQYLAVVRNVLGAGLADCGGRAPTVDVMDATYSAVATGLASAVPDGITAATDDGGLSDTTFPFLDTPL